MGNLIGKNENENVFIQKFNLDWLQTKKIRQRDQTTEKTNYFSILIIGQRNSGKTTLIKKIINNSDSVVIHSNFENEWGGVVEKEIENYYLLSDNTYKQKKEVDTIVYDNISPEKLKEVSFKNLIFNGPCLKKKVILSTQCLYSSFTPDIRANIDYVFVFRNNNLNLRKTIFNNFFGAVETFDLFNKLMDKLSGFECLVLEKETGIIYYF